MIPRTFSCREGVSFATIFACLVLVAASGPLYAAPTGEGAVLNDQACMQEQAGFNLNCTANDVRVSGIADLNGNGMEDEGDITFAPFCDATAGNAGADCSSDPAICLDADGLPEPDLCGDRCAFPGDTTTFSATFIFELSAQERYDVGAYFETAVDVAGDGALTGNCSIITLPEDETQFSRPDSSTGNFVDLDTNCKGGGCPQPDDLCGDINDENNPVYFDMARNELMPLTITAQCVDSDADGLLDLPSCTSWRQSGANELCTSPTDAFPGAPSKCNCDPGFGIPIDIPPANIVVTKTASPTSLPEPGGSIRFDVTILNQSPFADVTINVMDDNVYGDITTTANDITETSCTVPTVIGPGLTHECFFRAPVTGTAVQTHTDIVTASGVDENDNPVSDYDDADVMLTDVPSNMSVVKTANPTSVLEPGADVVYSVTVNNLSAVDVLTLNNLNDDIYGDITMVQGKISATNCVTGGTIAPGGSYACSFTALVEGDPGDVHTNTVTATATDDDLPTANELVRHDMATVDILDVPSSCILTKTATPTSVNEPGADVSFAVAIENTSTTDTITINSIVDVPAPANYGDCTTPQDIAPGATFNCSFTKSISGLGDTSEMDTVTAMGLDDDGQPVQCSDSETVQIVDIPPAANLVKEVTQMVVTYKVIVSNNSAVEPLTLDSLSDDQFGDITTIQGDVLATDCAVGGSIPVGGTYMCTFDGKVTTTPHINTVTGTVSDDEGNSVSPSDDAKVEFISIPTP